MIKVPSVEGKNQRNQWRFLPNAGRSRMEPVKGQDVRSLTSDLETDELGDRLVPCREVLPRGTERHVKWLTAWWSRS